MQPVDFSQQNKKVPGLALCIFENNKKTL